MVAFKIDENLPNEAADLLRGAGHHVHVVLDEQLNGAPDASIAAACQFERRCLITLDLDFADIRRYPPSDYLGLVVLRLSRQNKAHVIDVLARVLMLFNTRKLEGRLWIVDDHSIRVRD